MKTLLILLLAYTTALGQTRKNAVKSEIIGFIINDLKTSEGEHNAYYVFAKPIAFDNNVLSDPSLKDYFTTNELATFKKMGRKHGKEWSFSSSSVNIVKAPKLDSLNHTDFIYYSYSIPLISHDGNRLLATKSFFCRLLCGGGATYLYEKRNGLWRKVQVFNEWGE